MWPISSLGLALRLPNDSGLGSDEEEGTPKDQGSESDPTMNERKVLWTLCAFVSSSVKKKVPSAKSRFEEEMS